MPRPRKTLISPVNPSRRERAQNLFLRAALKTLIENKLTTPEFCELTGFKKRKVEDWLITSPNTDFRLITYPDLIHLSTIPWHEYGLSPTGNHGRVFNYVEALTGNPLTDFEQTLIIENENLKNKLNALT